MDFAVKPDTSREQEITPQPYNIFPKKSTRLFWHSAIEPSFRKGPVTQEKRVEWKRHAEQERLEQQRAEQERLEQQRREQQSKRWQEQGLCKYCGGKLGGLFSKKCKDCGREN